MAIDAYARWLASRALKTAQAGGTKVETWRDVRRLVQNGKAQSVFEIGDQLNVNWTDGSTTYDVPLDIVHFADVTLQDGETAPGMYLQWHYSTPFGIQFDAQEAFYYAETELPAGTYNVTVGANWGTYCKNGEQYQFTLTKPVPAGGQIVGFYGMPDNSPDKWSISTYSSAKSTSAIETVAPTAGAGGTNLGTLTITGDGKLNSIHRMAYGYNRWGQSAIMQYLNSAAPAARWWAPQNKWDRPPAELAAKPGFLTGFDGEFLNVIRPVRVRTALNTATDAADGTYEDTYNKIFLPALEQEFIAAQLAGIEGDAWDYWKQATGRPTPTPYYKNFEDGGQPITYAINARTAAQNVRLRSAARGSANSAWIVSTSGNVNDYSYAVSSNRLVPACVIC